MATVRGDIYDAVVAALEAVPEVLHCVKGPTEDESIATLVSDSACNGKCVLEVFMGEDDATPESQGHNHDAMVVPVVIACHLGQPGTGDTSSLENRACVLLGKIYEAMAGDPTWGGKALDSRVQVFSTGVAYDARGAVGTWVAVQMWHVRYRFRLGSPGTAV